LLWKLIGEKIMFKKSIFAMLTLFLSLNISNVYAYTSYGARGCGKLISAIDTTAPEDKLNKDLTEMGVKGWIAGYITANNSWLDVVNKTNNSDAISKTDIDGIWMSMLKFCRTNPLRDTSAAIVDTLNQLEPQQKKKR
jgi:hypothetical protein